MVIKQRGGLSELDTPAAVSVVDGDDLRRASAQINLAENLASVPGLQIQNRQNYAQDLQLSVRGFGSRSMYGVRGVRLYVDGIPATMPDGQGQTSNIDINSVGKIEVLRGPYSALYGNASGGVVNIDTLSGSQPTTLEAGTYFGSSAHGVIALRSAARPVMVARQVMSITLCPHRALPPTVIAIIAARRRTSVTANSA
ncbi:probable tonB-dependent receptor yncD precursor [Erwinia pyrifoliae DSM 12163]|nr:probable tonB-dependent receptor yncD precursor [Erwinia pyrifoliae DSM 12163]